MKLIIVESPTKAKTFNRLVDKKQYLIVSSMGHVRDLPKSKLGIDLEANFEPSYEPLKNKDKTIKEIVTAAKSADQIILATDPDREGEAIAYHIREILQKKIKKPQFSRIVFHEITKEALLKALSQSKNIDINLFEAQQARRILDRLFGYKLSPYLWKRFAKRWLSAGRVQSVALRFLVEREKEREAFKKKPIFLIRGLFCHQRDLPLAKLVKLKEQTYFQTQSVALFDGKYDYQTTLITTLSERKKQEARLLKETYLVDKIEESFSTRVPPPPFTTSTLQQYGSSYLGYSAKRTMSLAQQLYEHGLITYHRTDSNHMSEEFLNKCRSFIQKKYGLEYLEPKIRHYQTKSKLAQEAHEAIRPTKISNDDQSSAISKLRADQLKLYVTIYNRALSTQMTPAKFKNQKIVIESSSKDQLIINNQEVFFPGYLVLNKSLKKEGTLISDLKPQTKVKLKKLEIEEKETQSPPRYNEASLIKTLEAKGIGRPSTYAPIVSLIQERQYVEKQGRDLVPSTLGTKITNLLTDKFVNLLLPTFTAQMEDELDLIALGKKKWSQIVKIYFEPFNKQLEKAYDDVSKIKVEEKTGKKCPQCGHELVIKISRFGKFYACSGFPDCRYTENFLQTMNVNCPKCTVGEVVVRFSKKKKRFYACSRYPKCDFTSLWLPKVSKDETENQKKDA
ncbi:DNA topoisomerase I [Candidatus Roizmanbacteria bacterium RIFOXYC2_FULL_41_10]|nr:MAG: DNA topoisomerase I [Candidatus Roizmanbacteria bacterium RIFOXYC2_FULL_41_10]